MLWWTMLAGSVGHGAVRAGGAAAGLGLGPTALRWIVLGGLALPAVVLVPLVAYGLVAGERLLPLPGAAPPPVELEGLAHHRPSSSRIFSVRPSAPW